MVLLKIFTKIRIKFMIITRKDISLDAGQHFYFQKMLWSQDITKKKIILHHGYKWIYNMLLLRAGLAQLQIVSKLLAYHLENSFKMKNGRAMSFYRFLL